MQWLWKILRWSQFGALETFLQLYVRNAVSRLRPAGPPPTQTTSYMSGEAGVAYLLDCSLNDLEHDGQTLDLRVFERPFPIIMAYNATLIDPQRSIQRRVAVGEAATEFSRSPQTSPLARATAFHDRYFSPSASMGHLSPGA